MKIKPFILVASLFAIISCNNYQKVLKSNDSDLKLQKANEYYEKGNYYMAIPLFEELMGVYKGTTRTEEIYYKYCMAHYKEKNYLVAAYHFKTFAQSYPAHGNAEEALYLHANSYYNLSPNYMLEQANTLKALESFQYFFTRFPTSNYQEEINDKVESLRNKLEQKALYNAKQYYKTANYRAAAVTYLNLLEDFPDINGAEDIYYQAVLAQFKFAENSILSKQSERYKDAHRDAMAFSKKYIESEYLEEVSNIAKVSYFSTVSSQYDYAVVARNNKRNKLFKQFVNDVNRKHDQFDNDEQAKLDKMVEEAYFKMIRTNINLAIEAKAENKENFYNRAILAYNVFIDKYSSSKFAREAERLYNQAYESLKS